MAIGFALLAYVGWCYSAMWYEQHTLAKEWHEHRAAAAQNGQPAVVDDGLVRVVIPKAGVDAIVVDGVTRKELAVGPGHMPSTPQPGEVGNSVISAHRDTFFRKIADLRSGDEVIVRRAGKIFRFSVFRKQIVDPSNVSVLKPSTDTELTLITCYPTYFIGPAPKRLVVTSRLASEAADYGDQSTTSTAATSQAATPVAASGGAH